MPDFDVLLAGFPCQPFSIAGERKGFEDDRGNLFFELIRIIKKKNLRVVFLENVKNLVTHDKGNTFAVIKKSLEDLGYYVYYKIMNTKDYGNLPQNRERVYIVASLEEGFKFPEKIPLTTKLSDIKVEDRYYYTEKHKHYKLLAAEVREEDEVYQLRRNYV